MTTHLTSVPFTAPGERYLPCQASQHRPVPLPMAPTWLLCQGMELKHPPPICPATGARLIFPSSTGSPSLRRQLLQVLPVRIVANRNSLSWLSNTPLLNLISLSNQLSSPLLPTQPLTTPPLDLGAGCSFHWNPSRLQVPLLCESPCPVKTSWLVLPTLLLSQHLPSPV